jgi:hypothetical protein
MGEALTRQLLIEKYQRPKPLTRNVLTEKHNNLIEFNNRIKKFYETHDDSVFNFMKFTDMNDAWEVYGVSDLVRDDY